MQLAFWKWLLNIRMFHISKVRKRAKIRNRYNQAPHLTKDTNGKMRVWLQSRGPEFNPGLVQYFLGDWSWNNFYGHSPPFHWFIQGGLLSVTSESMCTNDWLSACSSLPRKKCGWVNWPSRNDHSCWLGT